MPDPDENPSIQAERSPNIQPKPPSELPPDAPPPSPGRDAKERSEGKVVDLPPGDFRPIEDTGPATEVEEPEGGEVE
jgi:hypothetical protein